MVSSYFPPSSLSSSDSSEELSDDAEDEVEDALLLSLCSSSDEEEEDDEDEEELSSSSPEAPSSISPLGFLSRTASTDGTTGGSEKFENAFVAVVGLAGGGRTGLRGGGACLGERFGPTVLLVPGTSDRSWDRKTDDSAEFILPRKPGSGVGVLFLERESNAAFTFSSLGPSSSQTSRSSLVSSSLYSPLCEGGARVGSGGLRAFCADLGGGGRHVAVYFLAGSKLARNK